MHVAARQIETPFARSEYDARVERVKGRMEEHGIDVLLCADPANMNYLTGYDATSYFEPQAVVVAQSLDQPLWVSIAYDAPAALATTHLDEENILAYNHYEYHSSENRHPMGFVAEALLERGLGDKRIGTEDDSICLTPRGLGALQAALPEATFVDADLLVNWVRTVKSDAEIAVMREAGRIATDAMDTATTVIRPGVRECDAAAEIYRRLISGNSDFGGAPQSWLMMSSGPRIATVHLSWTDAPYEEGTPVVIALGGCRHRYHAGLVRTVHLGTPPDSYKRVAEVVSAGFEAVLERIGAGVTCHAVATAFEEHLRRHGYPGRGSCGHTLGIGFPPAGWGERTAYLDQGHQTRLEPNMTLHLLCSARTETNDHFALSETVAVTDSGYELLSTYAGELLVF